MGKLIDLTGQRFGKLVVVEKGKTVKTDYGTKIYWNCECDCGVKVAVRADALRGGITKSCGCLAMPDITNMRFGRLTAIENSNIKIEKGSMWLCKCDCGNEVVVRKNHLLEGVSSSCGCRLVESGNELFEYHKENHLKEGTNLQKLSSKPQKNSTSGVKGVYWREKDGLWLAKMRFKGQVVLAKYFKNKQDAINARKEAEEKHFKPMLEKYGTKKTADSREAESAD